MRTIKQSRRILQVRRLQEINILPFWHTAFERTSPQKVKVNMSSWSRRIFITSAPTGATECFLGKTRQSETLQDGADLFTEVDHKPAHTLKISITCLHITHSPTHKHF